METKMKTAISMWSMDRKIQSEGLRQTEFIDWAKSAGFRYVELLSYYMEKEKSMPEVIALLHHTGIDVSCYTILTDFTDSSDSRFEEFLHDLEVASKLTAPFIRVLAGEMNSDKSSAITNIVRGLKDAAEAAAKKNVTLILENIGPYSCRSEDIKHILEKVDSPFLMLNFDTANSLLAGEDPLNSFVDLKSYISYIHFKDFISEKEAEFEAIASKDANRIQKSDTGVSYTGITAGKGIVPLSALMEALESQRYDGFVSIEYEGTGDSLTDTENSFEYLKSISW